jgi:hypothetical protein
MKHMVIDKSLWDLHVDCNWNPGDIWITLYIVVHHEKRVEANAVVSRWTNDCHSIGKGVANVNYVFTYTAS